MKCVQIQDDFGLKNLVLSETENPGEPEPDEVILKMKSASLNFRDILMAEGLYNPKQPLPLIPCSDGVGEVVALGQRVRNLSLGDRVTPLFCPPWQTGCLRDEYRNQTLGGPVNGTCSELMKIQAESVVKVPDYLSDAEAASLPCAALTAWNALTLDKRLDEGAWVLTQGTGGVSVFAIQIAKQLGYKVIATTGSKPKQNKLLDLGADEVINYREDESWAKTAKKIAGEQGIDLVVEVGGAGTLQNSISAVKSNGKIAVIGVLAGVSQDFNILPVLMRQITLQGLFVGNKSQMEALIQLLDRTKLRPIVDLVYPLSEFAKAFSHLKSGKHFGKVCIEIAG